MRRERLFKRAILLITGLVMVLIVRSVPWGRYLAASVATSARQVTKDALGYPKDRSAIDESWRNFRRLGIEQTRPRVEKFYAESSPDYQKLMRYAGMDPDHGLLRWGNYDWTLLLSSKVFEPDDQGRSYRMKPGLRSIWLRQLVHMAGAPAFYLVPDGPGLAEAIRGTEAVPLESSRQVTNSWGLRGPEPGLDSPLRGMVLGDSMMQGMFIGDGETPPDCLERYLQKTLKTRVSILNAGVMGYGPEQYYYSLTAFADRFRPHFVVVSLYINDFGNEIDLVNKGDGDWKDAKYWLEKIIEHCQGHRWPCLIVPAPYEGNLAGRRKSGNYPGMLANVLDLDSLMFLDPMEDFVNAHVASRIDGKRKGLTLLPCALFNDAIGDNHFSPAGSEVWAESVGRRLVLLMERDRVFGPEEASGGESRRSPPGADLEKRSRTGSE